MLATQIQTGRGRVLHDDSLANRNPSLGHVFGGASQLKVVDIDYQEHVPSRMEEARTPVINWNKANLDQVRLAMHFPESPRVRMAVQSQHKRTNWIADTPPRQGLLIFGQSDPSLDASQTRLCIGLHGVTLLKVVTRHHPKTIGSLPGLHGCRAT
jgi:hypothetical protein